MLSVIVLDEMKKSGWIPSVIVTTPDKPQGRKLVLTANVVKQWAIDNNILYYDPARLDMRFADELKSKMNANAFKAQVFVVASYGKIIPSAILSIPPNGCLNIHPSLLPKYRGPSPLPTAMLEDDKHTGITIMKMDEEMDHGSIIAQKNINIEEWPTYEEFEEMMAIMGAHLLENTLPKWINGDIREIEQDHSSATYTKKVTKEDGLIDIYDLKTDQYLNFRKIQAYHDWPQAYFFADRRGTRIRVKITEASFGDEKFTIKKVIPEGGKEMSYADFERGLK